jgi:ferric-dicitrate binding protein FerR (iron transport regulator)
MNCDLVRNQLGEFLVGGLDGESSSQVERHLESCDACSSELLKLQELEGRLWSIETAPSRASSRMWVAAAAAGFLVGLALVFGLMPQRSACLVEGRALEIQKPPQEKPAVPYGKSLTILEPALIELADQSVIEARPGARIELKRDREVLLLAGEAFFQVQKRAETFVVDTPIGTASVLGTSFQVEVMEERAVKASSVVAASAGAVVVVAVVTGAVLWKSNDEPSVSRIEAGMRATAKQGSVEIARMSEEVGQLRREREALASEKEGLAKEKVELEKKVSDLTERVKSLEDAAQEKKPASDQGIQISFGKWSEMEEITGANWKEMGEAAAKIVDMAKEIISSEISKDQAIQIATENQKLVPFALKINGKFPTHASGNGEFSHPLPHWNLIAERLEAAGVPLSDRQLSRVAKLGEAYDAQWDRLQSTYTTETLDLEKVIDELEIKKTYSDKLEDLLTREQREAIADPSVRHVNSLDVYSPVLLAAGRCKPIAKETKEGIRKSAIAKWSEQWKLDASQTEANSAVFDSWLADVDSRLAPVPERLINWFNIGDVIVSGRAQIKVMKDLLGKGTLQDASKEKISKEVFILVPRLTSRP